MGDLTTLARETGQIGDKRVRQLLAETAILDMVQTELGARMVRGMAAGKFHNSAAALLRLFRGLMWTRMSSIALEIARSRAVAWRRDEQEFGEAGIGYIMRQASCIGGGTTEMARNVIADRLIGMPREVTPDRDRPFRDVPKNATAAPS